MQLIDFGTLHDYCSALIPLEMREDIRKKYAVKAEAEEK